MGLLFFFEKREAGSEKYRSTITGTHFYPVPGTVRVLRSFSRVIKYLFVWHGGTAAVAKTAARTRESVPARKSVSGGRRRRRETRAAACACAFAAPPPPPTSPQVLFQHGSLGHRRRCSAPRFAGFALPGIVRSGPAGQLGTLHSSPASSPRTSFHKRRSTTKPHRKQVVYYVCTHNW